MTRPPRPRALVLALATAVAALLLPLLLAAPAAAATIQVTNTNDSGPGSFRQAILDANATPGVDTIAFSIPGGPIQSIGPTSPLPPITDVVILDATTQCPGAAGPCVELHGDKAGTGDGLRVEAGSSLVRGLVINPFTGIGIRLTLRGGNTIASNGGAGVWVNAGVGSAILGNAINANGGLGIDLAPAGVLPNDVRDPDTVPNARQNYPTLSSAVATPAGTTVAGTLNSAIRTTFRLELFASPSCDPSGFGEGLRFLGSTSVTTDALGDAAFSTSLPTAASAGQAITATATDPGGSTSEFSACRAATPPSHCEPRPPIQLAVAPEGGTGRLRVTVTAVGENNH